jgi:hypothetical protein
MKHLHKFFNKEDIPWVYMVWRYYPSCVPHASNFCDSFWWRDIIKLVESYRSICIINGKSGDTALLWFDSWNGLDLHTDFPRLFSFALDNTISVREVFQQEDISQLFYLPLSQKVFEELEQLQLIIASIELDSDGKDEWRTI